MLLDCAPHMELAEDLRILPNCWDFVIEIKL